MGYTSGTQNGKGSNQRYSRDAIMIGKCNPGDVLEKCTGGCNSYKRKCKRNNCSAGQAVKITIVCHGDSTRSSSCTVNWGNVGNR